MLKKIAQRRHLSYLSRRLVGTPLAIEERAGKAVINAVSDRLGLGKKAFMDDECDIVEADVDERGYEVVGNVAIVPMIGELCHRGGYLDAMSGLTSYSSVLASVQKAIDDPGVTGILIDVDSPGGEVAGLFDAAQALSEMKGTKPIWAFSNERMFSAAYVFMSGVDRILVSVTSGAGSCGVICFHQDNSVAYQNAGVKLTPIFAGAHKAEGSDIEPLSADVKGRIQAEVDSAYDLLVSNVARLRGMPEQDVRDTEAACFFGKDAVMEGLADEVTSFGNALSALASESDPNRQQPIILEGVDMAKAIEDEELKNARKARKAKAEQTTEDELDALEGDDEDNLDAAEDDEEFLGEDDDVDLSDEDELDAEDADLIDEEDGEDVLGDEDDAEAEGDEEDKPAVAKKSKKAKRAAEDEEDTKDPMARAAARRASKTSAQRPMTASTAASIVKICNAGGIPEQAERLIRKGGTAADASALVKRRAEVRSLVKRAAKVDPSLGSEKMLAKVLKLSGGSPNKARSLLLNRLAAHSAKSAVSGFHVGAQAVVDGKTLSGDADEIYARRLASQAERNKKA